MAQRPKIAAVPVGTSRTEVIALVMSVVWMVMVSAFFLIMPTTPQGEGFDSLRFILTVLTCRDDLGRGTRCAIDPDHAG